ncbi:IclR family transcriptional regulator [Arhodomonas sp. SL1]|uniref:IclR family transcriptional regulator n=1 Tax=Arhodomonas sp. SL1 TaxID=3425691 RepID=UPI003F880E77
MGRTRSTGSTGERLLKVLHTITGAGRPLSLPELTDAVGLPKPTVHRLVTLLESTGHLIREADARRYATGPALQRLALEVLQSQPGHAARHAVLRGLAEKVGEACNIVLLDGGQLTYIDRVDTQWPLRIRFDVGSHVPLHCTATGKLLLALQPKRVRDRIIKSKVLEPMTPQTITDADRLEAALAEIRRTRVGTDDQEFLSEMVAVAVPVMPTSGPPVVAVSIHAPVFRRSLDTLREFVPDLRSAARELETVLYTDVAEEPDA